MTDRIVSRRPLEEDQQWEPTLRPKIWDEYIGQEKVKENLRVFIEAARARREPLDHVLLHGPPGLGKTTLAYLIATELQVGIRATSGPVLERPGGGGRSSIPPWRSSSWTWSSARAPTRGPSSWTSRGSRWLEPPRGRSSLM